MDPEHDREQYDDDEEEPMTEEEYQAYMEAVALNQKLRAMADAEGMAGEFGPQPDYDVGDGGGEDEMDDRRGRPDYEGGGGGGGGKGGSRRGAPQAVMKPVEGATLNTRMDPSAIRRNHKANYTHSSMEEERIQNANMRLLQSMDAQRREFAGFSINEGYARGKHVASSTIQRKKESDKIAHENQRMVARLDNVRSSGLNPRAKAGGKKKHFSSVQVNDFPAHRRKRHRANSLVQPDMTF